ncbi:MAG TPA: hypothetical protein VMS64_22775, partial [Candidatus Methylomirabilis sp.]|nr:hypothetical protein [Candidatus Methylomirabilis sp.]
MPRSVTVVLLTIHAAVLAVSVTCSAQPRTPPGPGPASPSPSAPAMKFTRLGIRDPGINNIEAVSLLIPTGWKADGGVQWFPDYSILANLLLRVGDPQTGAVIEFLPVQNFTWLKQMAVPMAPGTNYMGNILWQPIGDIPRFIQTFYMPKAMTRLQSARIVGGGELPRVAAAVAQSYGGQSQVKSARVRYEYTQNGQPWEEDVFVTLVFTPWQLGTLWSVSSAYS